MTNKEAEELGRRAMACKAWRWMPGMLAAFSLGPYPVRVQDVDGADIWVSTDDCEVLPVDGEQVTFHENMPTDEAAYYWPAAWPDLRDPATLGCLLSLVREMWPYLTVTTHQCIGNPIRTWWCVDDWDKRSITDCLPTEAHALIAALEAELRR